MKLEFEFSIDIDMDIKKLLQISMWCGDWGKKEITNLYIIVQFRAEVIQNVSRKIMLEKCPRKTNQLTKLSKHKQNQMSIVSTNHHTSLKKKHILIKRKKNWWNQSLQRLKPASLKSTIISAAEHHVIHITALSARGRGKQ